jgi:hypothetical protein
MMALKNLKSVGGNIVIDYNVALTSLQGLANIDYTTIEDLLIESNYKLWNCSARSICDYIDDPGGFFSIMWNNEGCRNVGEVNINCQYPSVNEISAIKNFSADPNPFKNHQIITYELIADSRVKLSVFNQFAELMITQSAQQEAGKHAFTVDSQHWPSGVYLVRLQTFDGVFSTKVIKW